MMTGKSVIAPWEFSDKERRRGPIKLILARIFRNMDRAF